MPEVTLNYNKSLRITGNINALLKTLILGYEEACKSMEPLSKKVLDYNMGYLEGVKSTLEKLRKLERGEITKIGPITNNQYDCSYASIIERTEKGIDVHYFLSPQITAEQHAEMEDDSEHEFKDYARKVNCDLEEIVEPKESIKIMCEE